MAIAYVNGGNGADSGSSLTLSASAFVATAGNTIIVAVSNYTNYGVAVSKVEDTAGNTYTKCGTSESGDAVNHDMEIWVATNIKGNAANAVKVTFAASATYKYVTASQYSGLATSSVYDVGATGYLDGTTTNHTTNTTSTTTVANELIFACFVAWDSASALSATPPYYARDFNASGFYTIDKVVSSTGGYSITGASADYNSLFSMVRTFKMASASTFVPMLSRSQPGTDPMCARNVTEQSINC